MSSLFFFSHVWLLIIFLLEMFNSPSASPSARNQCVTGNAIAPTTAPNPRCLRLLNLSFCLMHIFILPTMNVSFQCALVCEKSPHCQEPPAPQRSWMFAYFLFPLAFLLLLWTTLDIPLFLGHVAACPVGVIVAGCVSVVPSSASGVVRQVVGGNVQVSAWSG